MTLSRPRLLSRTSLSAFSLTYLPIELFTKNASLDILMVFRLDLGQISVYLVENAFATRQLALFVTRIAFFNFSAQACAEIKILRNFALSFHSTF